ncbi:MAG TPA: DUF4476 domain-containing protein [Chitinophagaceae bacterium]|nr:DUF4476 domain-containing protein [Chitinophagaceae bacterium]
MKKFKAFLIMLLLSSASFSQKVYFMYLQADGAQPFFLKMKEQVYSSNTSGYLILSKLQDSTYSFSIGFPQNKWPEQVFSVPVSGSDKGFLLKNIEGKWSLLDLQTQQTIQGELAGKARSVRTEPKEVSAFTEVLSKAADDPSLKERVVPLPAVVKQEEKPVIAAPAVKQETVTAVVPQKEEKKEELSSLAKDTIAQQAPAVAVVPSVAMKKEENTEPLKDSTAQQSVVTVPVEEKKAPPAEEKKQETGQVKEPVDTVQAMAVMEKAEVKAEQTAAPVAYKPSVVTRKTESSTTEGFGITYIDEYPDGKKDTVQIFIPNPKTIAKQVPPSQEEAKFLPMDTETKDLTPAKKPEAQNAGGNNCKAMASETDYLKLRKKMVATDGDDAMLVAAKKIFKTKCFTSEQVRNLGTLFLNDAGRYNFFDAAYLAVSDRENFATLQAELKDEYYISRFKAMLR